MGETRENKSCFNNLSCVEPTSGISEKAFQLVVSKCEQKLAPNHKNTLDFWYTYRAYLRDRCHFDKAELLQRQLLSQCESVDKYSIESIAALGSLSLNLHQEGV
jgi:hypothetical protein